MGEEPTNAALRLRQSALADLGETFAGVEFADDYTFEDRRRGANFGTLDRDGLMELRRQAFEVTDGAPNWQFGDVVGVRSDALVAVETRLSYGDDAGFIEFILVGHFDPRTRILHRTVHFDLDGRTAALALLDEWHAELSE